MAKDWMGQRSPPWRAGREERLAWFMVRMQGRLESYECRVLRWYLLGGESINLARQYGGSPRRIRRIAERAVLRLVDGRQKELRAGVEPGGGGDA